MKVKLIAPAGVLPRGYVTVDMSATPRWGDTVLLYNEDGDETRLAVASVVHPVWVHEIPHFAEADMPEVTLVSTAGFVINPTPERNVTHG